MNTIPCSTVAVPALSRAQYASLVRQSIDSRPARRFRPVLAALAIVMLGATLARLAAADETPVPQGTEITTFRAATRHMARPVPSTPGKVALCNVLPSGALQCGAAVTLASVAPHSALNIRRAPRLTYDLQR